MNRSFINLIVEGYIIDNDLNTDDKNKKSQEIFDIMQEIKSEDYELYNYIHTLSKPDQKKFIYSILNEDTSEFLTFSGYAWMLFVIVGAMILTNITRTNVWSLLKNNIVRFVMFFKNIKKVFSDTFNKPAQAFEIIVSNKYNDCISRCELSPSFASGRKSTLVNSLRKLYSEGGFSSILNKRKLFSLIPMPGTPTDYLTRDQLDCILTCSLDSTSTLIAKYSGMYIDCVRKSDALYSDMKIYSALDLGRIPSNISSCKEIQENYKMLLEQYIYILKFVFTDDVSLGKRNNSAQIEYARWMDILNRKIVAASENNYSKLLDISKQYVGDSHMNNSNVRF